MAVLTWDVVGTRRFETGVSKAVFYIRDVNGAYPTGIAWSGISNITEKPSGAEPTPIYADNIKFLNLISPEEVALSIEAYMYPDAFGECDGSYNLDDGFAIGQQSRKVFGLCYQTKVGTDADPDAGYKIHLVYGCTAAPSERAYATINDSPEANTFTWEVSSVPVTVTGHKPCSILTVDSTMADPVKLAELEALLYGTISDPAELPLPDAIIALLAP